MLRRLFRESGWAFACASAIVFVSAGCGMSSSLDTGEKPGPKCGNSVIEPDEQCDRSNLGGASCVSLGEGEGKLLCDSTCMFDYSMCNRSYAPGYGQSGSGGGVIVERGGAGGVL